MTPWQLFCAVVLIVAIVIALLILNKNGII